MYLLYTYEKTYEIGTMILKKKKTKTARFRRETTRVRLRPPPAESGETSKVRRDQQTAHRIVDLISSY